MRIVNISVADGVVTYQDGQSAGVMGEHMATQLVIELPSSMVTDVDYHIISFDTGFDSVISDIITTQQSNLIYSADGTIYCTLWQELTSSTMLNLTVAAYSVTDNVPTLIEKSPIISVSFDMSVDESGKQSNTESFGIVTNALRLAQMATHEHSNKVLLDTYTNADADISSAVAHDHEHSNKVLLDAYTNADADISSAVLNSHTPSAVATFADLPATALKDEKCNVCSDVAQLTFSTYASLMFNPSPVDVPLFFAGTSRLGLYSFVDPEDANGGDCVVFSTTSDDFGNKFLQIIAIVGGVIYNYFSRDVTLLSSQYTAGWHDGNDIPCAAPTLTDFTVLRIEHGTTQYTAAADLTADVLSALRSASAVLNTSTAEMHMRGVYVFDGTASWTREHDENELELYTGTLCANHRYYATIGDDLTLTLPSSATLDKSRDNSILMYLNCTADIDITFADALYYGRALPDTTQGTHEIIAAYNVGAGKWQIGALETGAVS